MAHTEYVPIVNTQGDVIGKTMAMEALNYKNTYINPVIRIAVASHGMLFLCNRPQTAILDKGKTDIPMECYLSHGALWHSAVYFPKSRWTETYFQHHVSL